MDTTIAAIATPLAMGGVGMIRISGPESYEIAGKVFSPVSGKDVRQQKGYTALFGHIHDRGRTVDEAVALFFRAPHSYTGEDVVELSCHGGVAVLREVLRCVLDAGAVMAGPGEFSKRAVLGGKMTLTQAEGVMELISAKTRQGAAAALSVMDGRLYRTTSAIKQSLLEVAAQMAAYVDYPDEDIPDLEGQVLGKTLALAEDRLAALLGSFDTGKMLQQGIETAIVGRPNVGKSTLMNLLAGCDKSIVTQIPGTTRDVVEEVVELGEVVLRLADTAGLRETDDPVERIGVERSVQKLDRAALILALFDYSTPLAGEDWELLEKIAGRPAVVVVNKTDLPCAIDLDELREKVPQVVLMQASSGQGLEELQQAIYTATALGHLDMDSGVLVGERQRQSAVQALAAVRGARQALQMGMTYDAVAVDIDAAVEALSELTGESASQQVIDTVFANFCVGK